MAVKHVETFSFELPLDAVEMEGPDDSKQVIVTMDRAGLTRLHLDMAEALGYSREFQQHHQLHQEFEEQLEDVNGGMSVEEALAAMQIQERAMQHTAPPNQPRGSAIGNSHV